MARRPLPQVKEIGFTIDGWQGLNRVKGNIANGEMVEMTNMSSDNTPYSSPRPSRATTVTGITAPSKLFDDELKMGYIADGKFIYDGVDKGECGATTAVLPYDNKIFCYPANKVYDVLANTLTTPSSALACTNFSDKKTVDNHLSNLNDEVALFKLTNAINVTGFTNLTINYQGISPDTIRLEIFNGATALTRLFDNGVWPPLYYNNYTLPTNATSVKVYFGYNHISYNSGYYYEYKVDSSDLARKNADLAKTVATTSKVWLSTTTYPAEGGVPTIEYATEFNNRIFAVEGNNIYASALGDFADWTTFVDDDGNPAATGAFVTDVGSVGRFNGIVTYKDRVVITKEDYVYELYGNRPPFTIKQICQTGCIDGRSIIEVNSILFWLGRAGIYQYTGGQPRIMSQKLNETFTQGVAGTDGRKYYCSLYNGTVWRLYVYDTFNGLWHIEDNIEIKDFTLFDGSLLALTSTGDILKFNSGSERVEWSFETQDYTFGIAETKNVSKVLIRADMQPQTNLDVYVKINNGDFERVANYSADNQTTFDFKVRIKKCDTFALKFKGIGNVKILDVHAKVNVGTSKHRNGDNLTVYRG